MLSRLIESAQHRVKLKTLAYIFCIGGLVCLEGCTSSEWLLSTIYNRMDNILARETKEYADFTSEQSQQIDQLADQYHLWHRTQHLPRYAGLLEEIRVQLSEDEGVSRPHVSGWSGSIEGYAREMADCYPLNNAFDLLRSLSDSQVEQVLAHGIEEYDEFVEDWVDMSSEKRLSKRYRETYKWFRRFQLDLNAQQQEQLKATIGAEQKLGGAGMELWKTWHLEFVDILREREVDTFESRVGSHIQLLWTLQDDNFPDVVEYNRQLWIDYFSDLSVSLSQAQRDKFSGWLEKMEANLESISADLGEQELALLAEEEGACLAPHMLANHFPFSYFEGITKGSF